MSHAVAVLSIAGFGLSVVAVTFTALTYRRGRPTVVVDLVKFERRNDDLDASATFLRIDIVNATAVPVTLRDAGVLDVVTGEHFPVTDSDQTEWIMASPAGGLPRRLEGHDRIEWAIPADLISWPAGDVRGYADIAAVRGGLLRRRRISTTVITSRATQSRAPMFRGA